MPAPFTTTKTVTVGAALTDVVSVTVESIEKDMVLQLENTGANATNGLAILRQFTDGGPWVPWLSGTDFNTATSEYSPSTNPSPNAIPAGQVATVEFDPGPCVAVKAQASSASGSQVRGTLLGRLIT